jgi:hypothetical protein
LLRSVSVVFRSFFSGVVVFIPQSPFTQPHIFLFKQACCRSFVHSVPQAPLHSLLLSATLALSEKNLHSTQKSRQTCRLQQTTWEYVRFYNFVILSTDNYLIYLEFTRFLREKFFWYYEN